MSDGFGGVPSWCRVGAKVVCIRGNKVPMGGSPSGVTLPTDGGVYTIRTIEVSDGIGYIRLVEIVNPKDFYILDGFTEPSFDIQIFKPLVSQKYDLETHFEQYLKTDHRAPEKAGA